MEQDVTQRIREVVAQRSQELGGRGLVAPADVSVTLNAEETAPGCRLFAASWGAGRGRGALSGLLRDEDPPDTYPGQALGKLFARWAESGEAPAAAAVAASAALLLDPARCNDPVLTEEDLEDAPGARLPQLLGGDPPQGVSFWWSDGGRPRNVTVRTENSGGVTINESATATGGAP
ncbi:hypothetical protein AS189_14320 [Arthrobacter alpinus]|uniref:Uncharacterized protein n=1 Tax=Arthrobacter alpinus TaxID=656366 RepID=A0A0S2M0V4_9MICC|nr:hypothetical protein [Arthrobacter alpinus]ALO67449.1 hypothetical protein AS189_14320 [Arthrobacter alpinus]